MKLEQERGLEGGCDRALVCVGGAGGGGREALPRRGIPDLQSLVENPGWWAALS